jgi:hypothetical protein
MALRNDPFKGMPMAGSPINAAAEIPMTESPEKYARRFQLNSQVEVAGVELYVKQAVPFSVYKEQVSRHWAQAASKELDLDFTSTGNVSMNTVALRGSAYCLNEKQLQRLIELAREEGVRDFKSKHMEVLDGKPVTYWRELEEKLRAAKAALATLKVL